MNSKNLAEIGSAFNNAARCLAIAANSLSAAAQALFEVAESFSEMSPLSNPSSSLSRAPTIPQETRTPGNVSDHFASRNEDVVDETLVGDMQLFPLRHVEIGLFQRLCQTYSTV